VQVGQSIYKTDKWPPFGDSIFTLALIFKVAVVVWVGWPIIHVAAAVIYRFQRVVPA
jgi:divalent metal cation (Fe/Co/Zn/Cd) transporter